MRKRTRRHCHLAPAGSSPDPETRELAALGNALGHIAGLGARARLCWLWDFANAAERYKDSLKWDAIGKAMSAQPDRLWLYADVVIGYLPAAFGRSSHSSHFSYSLPFLSEI